jgi:hypothetical protein
MQNVGVTMSWNAEVSPRTKTLRPRKCLYMTRAFDCSYITRVK